MSDHENMDTSPQTEEDTASGGPAEPREQNSAAVGDETGDAGAPQQPGSTQNDGIPVDNPAG